MLATGTALHMTTETVCRRHRHSIVTAGDCPLRKATGRLGAILRVQIVTACVYALFQDPIIRCQWFPLPRIGTTKHSRARTASSCRHAA